SRCCFPARQSPPERAVIALPRHALLAGTRGSAMKDFVLALRAMTALALPYFRSEDRWAGRALLAGVIAAEFALVYIAVVTNQWQGRFFNALEARDWDRVQTELILFGFIVLGNILIGMGMF